MDWTKIEKPNRYLKIGDANDKDTVATFEGVLARIVQNRVYPEKLTYLFHDGEGLVGVNENAGLRDLDFKDYGKPVRIKFLGWGETKTGNRMKQIEVATYDGAPEEVRAKFPKAGKYHPDVGTKESLRGQPNVDDTWIEEADVAVAGGEDDQLPF